MLASNILARGAASRRILPRLAPSLQQCRALSTFGDQERFWQHVAPWKDVSAAEFVSYAWQLKHTVHNESKLYRFLSQALPDVLGPTENERLKSIQTRDSFIEDALAGIKLAPMAIRLTPHILSRVNWAEPLDDPIRKQFLPLRSSFIPDHSQIKLDSLHEESDSPVPGLVHRYPGRALFLATSICPVYCRFCTRSYAVGAPTETVSKKPQKPCRSRWDAIFDYIRGEESLKDIVVSGGDAYFLSAENIREIGDKLLQIPHIRRIRFASKGLAVAPGRILDDSDGWTNTLIGLSNQGRQMGKHVCLHTHINHPKEITWVTTSAANKLFKHGVVVRNQAVLLRGVNNSVSALRQLVEGLADINIQPYYIYQCDMVKGVEDLRTPLHETIALDKQLRGTLSGFMMPSFVVDLPGGGGKRLVSTYETYENGVATYKAPGLKGNKGKIEYKYYDPEPITIENSTNVHQDQQVDSQSSIPLQAREPSPPNSSDSPSRSSQTLEHMTLDPKKNSGSITLDEPLAAAA